MVSAARQSLSIPATALLDPRVIDDPYPFYRRLHAEAPVWRVPGTKVVVVSSYDLLTEATARVEDFSSNMRCLLYKNDDGLPEQLPLDDMSQRTLVTADPPAHTLHRRTVFPELVAKRMIALEPGIRELAVGSVQGAVDEGRVEFMATVANLVPITVVNDLVGFRDSDPLDLLQAAFDSTAMLGSLVTLADFDSLIVRIDAVQTWVRQQLETVRAEDSGQHDDRDSDNVLGTIAAGVEDGTFSEDEATLMLHTLLGAGGETTSSLLGNSALILAERPDLQQQLRERPDLLPSFVEEVLRLEAPLRMMLRSVARATSLGGVDLQEGDTLILLFGAANRDPAQYERPDELDLDRDQLRTHLAFGKGIHYCVGARLARLEGQIVLAELLARTSLIELDPDESPRRAASLLVRRYDRLPLKLTPA
jgi:cytochrome P450